MAGLRPGSAVIGIAGELVKGTTSTVDRARDDPRAPLTEAELERIVERAQESALAEAEARIAWESGVDRLDVRLVHAAIVEMKIDGYPVSNPIGFTGAPAGAGGLQRVRADGAPRRAAVGRRRARLAAAGRDRRAVRGGDLPGPGRAGRRRRGVRGHRRRHDRRGAGAPWRDRRHEDARPGRSRLHEGAGRAVRPLLRACRGAEARGVADGLPEPTDVERAEALAEDAAVWRGAWS